MRRRVQSLLLVRRGGDYERARRGHSVRPEHAKLARSGFRVRRGGHGHEQALAKRRRRLQRVAADVHRALHDRYLLRVERAENLPPAVGAPLVHMGLRVRWKRRRGAVALRNAVEPLRQIAKLRGGQRRKVGHHLDGQHLHAFSGNDGFAAFSREGLPAHDEAVRGAGLDAARVDVADVGVGGLGRHPRA